MLSDYRYGADLSLADRLRILAADFPETTLEYRTLQEAADLLEKIGFGPT